MGPTAFEAEYPAEAAALQAEYASPGHLGQKIEVLRVAPGRNDPCDCGSGEKAKRCCLVPRTKTYHSPGWWSMRVLRVGDQPMDLQIDSTQLVQRKKPYGPAEPPYQRGIHRQNWPIGLAMLLAAGATLPPHRRK